MLADADGGDPELILLATGSEVSLALGAHETARRRGRPFARRLDAVLGFVRAAAAQLSRGGAAALVRARVAVEQACPLGWDRYVGLAGATVTMSSFGASAPFAKLQEKFGFTVAQRRQGGAKRNDRWRRT